MLSRIKIVFFFLFLFILPFSSIAQIKLNRMDRWPYIHDPQYFSVDSAGVDTAAKGLDPINWQVKGTYILADSVVLITARQYYMLWKYVALAAETRRQPNKHWQTSYIMSLMVWLTFEGFADARVYELDKSSLSDFAAEDMYYLGARIGSALFAATSLYYWKPESAGKFFKRTIGAVLIGSALWDVAFCLERYNKPFADLPAWAVLPNGRRIGFSRDQLIVFDVLRLGTGIYLLVK